MALELKFLTTQILAQVLKEREELERAYENYPDATYYWGAVDLVSSSNFRLTAGLKQGYVRGETFFSLVAAVLEPNPEVRLVKEIGDAVLLLSTSLRPLLESMIILTEAATQLTGIEFEDPFPFAVRSGIDYGPAKKLTRRHEDYLGSPIDRLFRLMGVRQEGSSLVIHEDVVRASTGILKEYSEFLMLSDVHMLPEALSKGMREPVYYRTTALDRLKLQQFRQCFAPWRKVSA